MVGNHVFPRPEAWEWVNLPQKSTVSAKLLIRTGRNVADVVFVESRVSGGWASADETIARWEKNFVQSPADQHLVRQQRKLRNATATFFWQEGTYKNTGAAGATVLQPGFAQYGVILEDGKNNILARILGDKAVVVQAKDEFKQLVERALAESE